MVACWRWLISNSKPPDAVMTLPSWHDAAIILTADRRLRNAPAPSRQTTGGVGAAEGRGQADGAGEGPA